jgi:hypothetical protein
MMLLTGDCINLKAANDMRENHSVGAIQHAT